ncbi:hypothetical protein C0991_005651 [Blastosporella zonata]|nr:hypothetical protein C0991_005651 [Blastosporella zonata]
MTSDVLDSLGRVLQRQCQLETLVESLNLQLKATEDFEACLALVEETLRSYTGPSDSSSTSPAWSPNNTAIVPVPETPNNKETQGQVDKKVDGGRLIAQHGPAAASPVIDGMPAGGRPTAENTNNPTAASNAMDDFSAVRPDEPPVAIAFPPAAAISPMLVVPLAPLVSFMPPTPKGIQVAPRRGGSKAHSPTPAPLGLHNTRAASRHHTPDPCGTTGQEAGEN